jgi:hypothetical protein
VKKAKILWKVGGKYQNGFGKNSMHDEQKKHGHLDSHNSSTRSLFLKEDSSNKK